MQSHHLAFANIVVNIEDNREIMEEKKNGAQVDNLESRLLNSVTEMQERLH